MKLTIALALLACSPMGESQGLKVNDVPDQKMHDYDATQLGDLATANIEGEAATEEEDENDDEFAETEVDDEALFGELEEGDLNQLMEDPVSMFDALETSADAEEDEADTQENTNILKEYQKELKELNAFFGNMKAAMEASQKQQVDMLKKEYQIKWNKASGKHKMKNKWWIKKCKCNQKCMSEDSPFGPKVNKCLRKCVKKCKKVVKKRKQKKWAKKNGSKDAKDQPVIKTKPVNNNKKQEKKKPTKLDKKSNATNVSSNATKKGGKKEPKVTVNATANSSAKAQVSASVQDTNKVISFAQDSNKFQKRIVDELNQQIRLRNRRRSLLETVPSSEQMMDQQILNNSENQDE